LGAQVFPFEVCGDTISANFQGDTSIYSYSWEFHGISYSGSPVVIPISDPGFSVITMRSTDSSGCWSEVSAVVDVKSCWTLYAPSGFSPDGDGRNDTFLPVGVNIEIHELLIFDRWGLLLKDGPDAWDGTYQGQKVQQDCYVWKIIFVAAGVNSGAVGKICVVK